MVKGVSEIIFLVFADLHYSNNKSYHGKILGSTDIVVMNGGKINE